MAEFVNFGIINFHQFNIIRNMKTKQFDGLIKLIGFDKSV